MNLDDRARIHAALGDPHRLTIVDALIGSDRTPSQLADILGVPMNLLAHHLHVLDDAGVIDRRMSEGDRRRRYVAVRYEILGALGLRVAPPSGRVVFVCTHNSARSQYAAAAFTRVTGELATSAGLTPADRVHPLAIRVAAERDLDLTGARPHGYEFLNGTVDVVISVCDRAAEERIPPAPEHWHWSVPDPVAKGGVDAFRSAFDELDRRIAGWLS